MRLEANMTLSNLNTRPEKAGQAVGPGAADLALTAKVHLAALKGIVSDHTLAILEHMYDAAGNLASQDFSPFSLLPEFDKCKAVLRTQLAGSEIASFGECKFNNFKISLELNKTVELSARLQTHPTPEQVSELFKVMAREVHVTVESIQTELTLAGGTDKRGQRQRQDAPTSAPAKH